MSFFEKIKTRINKTHKDLEDDFHKEYIKEKRNPKNNHSYIDFNILKGTIEDRKAFPYSLHQEYNSQILEKSKYSKYLTIEKVRNTYKYLRLKYKYEVLGMKIGFLLSASLVVFTRLKKLHDIILYVFIILNTRYGYLWGKKMRIDIESINSTFHNPKTILPRKEGRHQKYFNRNIDRTNKYI